MSTSRDMAGALNHRSGLEPLAQDETIAMDPLTAKGEKILHNMEKEYGGTKKGKSVFYASKNKGTISGVDEADEEAEDCEAMDGGPDSGPRQRIAMELREIAERMESARTEAEQEALMARRNQLLIELRKPDVTNDGGPGSGPQPGGGKQSAHPMEAKLSQAEGHIRHMAKEVHGGSTHKALEEYMKKSTFGPATVQQLKTRLGHDAMTNEELDKWESEKRDAHNMAPKDAANIEKGRLGGRPSPHAGHAFNQKDEDNTAGTGS